MCRSSIRAGVATESLVAEVGLSTAAWRDVFAYKPTVVTVMLGMNDASYRAFDQKIFDVYAKGFEHLVESTKSNLPGVRITLIQPSPYDDVTRKPTFEGGYNQVLVRTVSSSKVWPKRRARPSPT